MNITSFSNVYCIYRTKGNALPTQITNIHSLFLRKIHKRLIWACFYTDRAILNAGFCQSEFPIFYLNSMYWAGFYTYWNIALVTDMIDYFSIKFKLNFYS